MPRDPGLFFSPTAAAVIRPKYKYAVNRSTSPYKGLFLLSVSNIGVIYKALAGACRSWEYMEKVTFRVEKSPFCWSSSSKIISYICVFSSNMRFSVKIQSSTISLSMDSAISSMLLGAPRAFSLGSRTTF